MKICVVWGFDMSNAKYINPFIAFQTKQDAEQYCNKMSMKNNMVFYFTEVWLNPVKVEEDQTYETN